MPFRTLGARIALPAGFFALVSVAVLSFLLIRTQRESELEEAKLGSASLAETIYLTISHDMRENRLDAIRAIFQAVGRQEGIERVRIFDKQGKIFFSSDPGEVGRTLSRQQEACAGCHQGSAAPTSRSQTFKDAAGHTTLGTFRVIPNEVGCQGAHCHASPQEESVLGVLDVAASLRPAEERIASASFKAFLFSMLAVSLITGGLYWMIVRSVRRPLDVVVAATRRVAQGNPAVQVPRGAAREIGMLASSFNEMVESLSSSRSQLDEWAETLEEKARELADARFQVVQAEKLSSVGLVAAGIAHELNSPLMAIITFAHLVKQAVPPDAPAQEDLRMIVREANRCAGIIRQLLDYARKQSAEPTLEPCRIADAVEGALDLIKVEIQNGRVEVDTSLPGDLPLVEANQVQLMQVFVNLVLNAVQAMPEGGKLTIRSEVVPRSSYRYVDLPPHPGSTLLRTEVRDTGTGIPPEALTKVFDPFFTTKPVGKGSGLGLSVSLGIVRSYRGSILAASDGRTGTTFTVLLPVPVHPSPRE